MSEQPVFWLGGKPGGAKTDQPVEPEAERYEPALREVCEDCGFQVAEYVAAQGGFGGWLAHLSRDDKRFRLFWNGKLKQLSLEQAEAHGGWKSLHQRDTTDDGLAGFVIAVREILADSDAV